MKTRFIKTSFFAALVALIFAACKKNNAAPTYQSQGVITGVQVMFCANAGHCGGVEIKINGDPAPNPPSYYLIDTAITQFGISANAKFPVNVSLNWKHDPTDSNYIIVTKLKVN